MIYIKIPSTELKSANDFIKSIDPHSGDSFVPNKIDKNGNKFCLISLPDNNSEFNKKLMEKYGYTDYIEGAYNTRGIKKENAVTMEVIKGKLTAVDKVESISALTDISDE